MKMMIRKFFAFSITATLFACSKDTPQNPVNSTSAFTYKADGSSVTADSAHAVLYSLGVAPFNRMIDVYAYKGGEQVMEFHFKPVTGSSAADGTFSNSWLTYLTGINYPNDYYNSVSGTLNVTKCDTVGRKIEGTFNFIGNNGTADKPVTDGIMKVDITEIR